MADNRYDTDAPGAGTYRIQSEFGVYSASDTLNMVCFTTPFARTATQMKLTSLKSIPEPTKSKKRKETPLSARTELPKKSGKVAAKQMYLASKQAKSRKEMQAIEQAKKVYVVSSCLTSAKKQRRFKRKTSTYRPKTSTH